MDPEGLVTVFFSALAIPISRANFAKISEF